MEFMLGHLPTKTFRVEVVFELVVEFQKQEEWHSRLAKFTHAASGHRWSWSLRTMTMSFLTWIKPIAFVLCTHISLVSLVARLGLHMMGPLPQWALG
jgi:hypothetical protein